eukprot:2185167-Rhodomonas_salina.1
MHLISQRRGVSTHAITSAPSPCAFPVGRRGEERRNGRREEGGGKRKRGGRGEGEHGSVSVPGVLCCSVLRHLSVPGGLCWYRCTALYRCRQYRCTPQYCAQYCSTAGWRTLAEPFVLHLVAAYPTSVPDIAQQTCKYERDDTLLSDTSVLPEMVT